MNAITTSLLFICVFFVLDMLYIYSAKETHLKMIQDVQKKKLKLRIVPAILFYLLLPIAYIYFIKPLAKGDDTKVFLYAALLGFLMYSTFDLTNLALFDKFTPTYAVMDIAWGTFNLALTSFIVHRLVK